MSIKVGTEFRWTFADSSLLWRVTSQARPGVFNAVCVDEPFEMDGRAYSSDGAGTTRRFTEEDIILALRHTAMWDGVRSEHDEFWASARVGATVHYHNGFGAYVRGVVVEHEGKRCFQPTALVGDWKHWDLPQRSETGEARYSSGGRLFEAGRTPWQPSPSCMFEHDRFVRPHPSQCQDPAGLDPIDLALPEPTPEQAELEKLHRLRRDVVAALQDGSDVRAQLAAATFLLLSR